MMISVMDLLPWKWIQNHGMISLFLSTVHATVANLSWNLFSLFQLFLDFSGGEFVIFTRKIEY